MVETFKPGAEFRVECFDWTGGQISNDDSANDVRDVDLTKVHYLSGPFAVEGAEPGDLLVVDLLDIGYLPDSPWGFTGIFAKENGGGRLDRSKKCRSIFTPVTAVAIFRTGNRSRRAINPPLVRIAERSRGVRSQRRLLWEWTREFAMLICAMKRVRTSLG